MWSASIRPSQVLGGQQPSKRHAQKFQRAEVAGSSHHDYFGRGQLQLSHLSVRAVHLIGGTTCFDEISFNAAISACEVGKKQ
eukprot:11085807-Karenia_brevis.AAC.1